MAVKIGNLAKEVMKQLEDYGIETGLEVEKVSREVAEDTAKMLNKNSPKLTGDYAESWTYGVGETKRTRHTMIVHAANRNMPMSHLLEKGIRTEMADALRRSCTLRRRKRWQQKNWKRSCGKETEVRQAERLPLCLPDGGAFHKNRQKAPLSTAKTRKSRYASLT